MKVVMTVYQERLLLAGNRHDDTICGDGNDTIGEFCKLNMAPHMLDEGFHHQNLAMSAQSIIMHQADLPVAGCHHSHQNHYLCRQSNCFHTRLRI